jgi:hypothetical protein
VQPSTLPRCAGSSFLTVFKQIAFRLVKILLLMALSFVLGGCHVNIAALYLSRITHSVWALQIEWDARLWRETCTYSKNNHDFCGASIIQSERTPLLTCLLEGLGGRYISFLGCSPLNAL